VHAKRTIITPNAITGEIVTTFAGHGTSAKPTLSRFDQIDDSPHRGH